MDKVAHLFLKVENFSKAHQILEEKRTYIIACSGGPDSLFLAHFFLAMQKKWRLNIIIAHFEHGIRGEKSLADADFVKSFFASQNITCIVEHFDVPKWAKKHKYSLETAARILRYRFLRKLAQKHHALIATGHHQNDQAETILMRILRGTGIRGLRGIRANAGGMVRPLLSLTKKEIAEGITALHITPRHDETNDLHDALRNRIRLELIPYLSKNYNPSIEIALCRLGEIVSLDRDFFDREIEKVRPFIVREEKNGISFSRSKFLELQKALGMELLRTVTGELECKKKEWNFEHLKRLYHMFTTQNFHANEIFPANFRVFIQDERVYLLKTHQKNKTSKENLQVNIPLTIPAEILFPLAIEASSKKIIRLKFSISLSAILPPDLNKNRVAFDYDLLSGNLCLRTREKGDFMEIESGHKKLKNLLIDQKIPMHIRQSLPFLCILDEVLWGYGIRQSARGRVTANSKKILICAFEEEEIYTK